MRIPGKRPKLVERLLADTSRYAQHWLSFWNDLLRNDYRGTGYIDEGRKQITDWLYTALANNMPFDKFVAQLVNPGPESEGFVNGIVWRGVVNASQTPQMQAAQNISQVFMGVNLKCASCHDSFINDWTLADAYGLASVYADGELEMVRCDKPTGKKAPMKFLYPELGSIDPKKSKKERLAHLAQIITETQNGRLPRTIVNRLWAKFMGRGLVEPVDDMEQPAWNQDLLDWLAADLVANGYDLKKTMARILTSDAYQMPSVPTGEAASKDYVFRGPLVRRLSAEQFHDAVSQVTGVWAPMPDSKAEVDFSAGTPAYALAEVENPAYLRWIWNDCRCRREGRSGQGLLPPQNRAPRVADPSHRGRDLRQRIQALREREGNRLRQRPQQAPPRGPEGKPRRGENVLAIAAVNGPAAPDKKEAEQANPAGLLCYLRVRQESTDHGIPIIRILDIGSSDAWLCSTNKSDGWEKPDFARNGLEAGRGAWSGGHGSMETGEAICADAFRGSVAGHVRASLVAADPLMTALGRPNREQVMTLRFSAATTLQALELTNGKTLYEQLEHRLGEARETGGKSRVDRWTV